MQGKICLKFGSRANANGERRHMRLYPLDCDIYSVGGTPCMVFPLGWHISSALQKEGTPLLPILRMRRRHGATA